MEPRLALIPDEDEPKRGVVKPIAVKDGDIIYGLSIGRFTNETPDGYTHVILYRDISTIIHEVATSKSVNAEIRADKKAMEGVEKKPIITLDVKTKRFSQIV